MMTQNIGTELQDKKVVLIEYHLLEALMDLLVMLLACFDMLPDIHSFQLLCSRFESLKHLGVRSEILLEHFNAFNELGVFSVVVTKQADHIKYKSIKQSRVFLCLRHFIREISKLFRFNQKLLLLSLTDKVGFNGCLELSDLL